MLLIELIIDMVEPYKFIYWKEHVDYKDTSKKKEVFRNFALEISKQHPSISITGKFYLYLL